jgi:hypothetical protein
MKYAIKLIVQEMFGSKSQGRVSVSEAGSQGHDFKAGGTRRWKLALAHTGQAHQNQ